MNFELARSNMVAQQLRTWDVLDASVLQLFARLPRERFVPAHLARLAYSDTEIPIGSGEFMMAPKTEARMLQALAPEAHERCLEIGTGSGFVTALLSQCTREVVSLEINPALFASARTRLMPWGRNLQLLQQDGISGHAAGAPYELIVVTASVPEIPRTLLEQLSTGGRLFLVVGTAPVMEARLITRLGPNEWSSETLFETLLAPLRGAEPKARFEL